MKRIHWLYILTLVSLPFLGCDEEDQKTEAEKRASIIAKGTKSWSPTINTPITVNGVDVSSLFEGFSMKFTNTGTGGSYTTTGSTPVWARSGTWSFVDKKGNSFIRNDGVDVEVIAISNSSLTLSLEWPENTYENGRNNSLAGTTIFTLTR